MSARRPSGPRPNAEPPPRSPLRLLIVGVGGQGVLTVARVLGDAALAAGREVAVGQLHGMAQRGGSVEATVVMDDTVHSSFVERADVVLGFEPLEVLRALPRLTPTTHVVFNHGQVAPFSLSMKGLPYPDVGGILRRVREVTARVTEVDGPALLSRLALDQGLNMVMLGAVAGLHGVLPMSADVVRQAIESRGGSHGRQTRNLSAFDIGVDQAAAPPTAAGSTRPAPESTP